MVLLRRLKFLSAARFALRYPRSLFAALVYDLKLATKPIVDLPETLAAQPKYHFVYFSCAKDFSLLVGSLKTLGETCQYPASVHINIDSKDLFSTEQKLEITKTCRFEVRFQRTKHPMHWGGTRRIVNQLVAFASVLAVMARDDVLVKLDSDTLFFDPKLFSNVMKSSALVVGQPQNIHGEIYIQGGCYFLRPLALTAILNASLTSAAIETAWRSKRVLPEVPEDHFVTILLQRLGLEPQLWHYYMDEALGAGCQTKEEWDKVRENSPNAKMIHFEKDKMALKRLLNILNTAHESA